jgi:hypothetical protein
MHNGTVQKSTVGLVKYSGVMWFGGVIVVSTRLQYRSYIKKGILKDNKKKNRDEKEWSKAWGSEAEMLNGVRKTI